MSALFEAVRREASSSAWSRGVELVRADAVLREPSDDESEIVCRVVTRGGLVSVAVVLHPEDEEWSCDCPSTEDPCEHVTAAVIALRQGRLVDAGAPATATARPGAESAAGTGSASIAAPPRRATPPPGRLRYLLSRDANGLALERAVVRQDEAGEHQTMLASTLAAIASGRVEGPRFVATPGDIAVERALGARLRGPMPREAMQRLLPALAACPDVRLDGVPVRANGEPLPPRIVVEDSTDGFFVRAIPDPAIREAFANGVVLCEGGELRPVADARLSGREREEYGRGRRFSADDAALLAGELLPDLGRRVPVDVRTRRLPGTTRETPRLRIEVERDGDALVVLPLLVYGAPPIARVDAGRLISLGGRIPLRDEAAEQRLLRDLERRVGLLPGRRERFEGEAALRISERLAHSAGDVVGSAHTGFFRAPPLDARVRVAGDDVEIAFESELAPGRRLGPAGGAAAVMRAWRDGEPLVALSGGGFAPLPLDWLAKHGARVADLLAAKQGRGALPRVALPDLAALCHELALPAPPGFSRLRALLDDFTGLPEPKLPADLTATLRPYQRAGVAWLQFLREAELGGLLADDMGLGKTLQALCVLPAHGEGRTLVVAPTSVVHNWCAEIARFRPSLAVCLYHGPKRTLDPAADVVVTSYALLRLDAERLCRERFDVAIADEAQQIKNPDSQAARAAHRVQARFRVALTGTPVENRLDELWSVMELVCPGLLGSRSDFDERVARPIAGGDVEAGARLRERLRPFLLRRRKRDVASELPPRTDVVERFELDAEERAVYDAVHAATRRDVVAQLASGGSVLAALEALLRLRQAACHAGLVPGQHATRSSKTELLLDELDVLVADGHRALVFSQWTSLLDRIEPLLREHEIPHLRLDGSTRDRAGVVAQFQREDGPPVLLVSLRAGGTGLNLTAADHVYLLDPWWNPAVEEQAADRAHRIGQDRPVVVHRLVARETVEERILELQAKKRALGDLALGDAEVAGRLTRDDLLALLD